MTNRLRKSLRATTFCVGFCLFFLSSAWLRAQPSFFNFSYNGPDTLYVGPTCSSMLQGNVPNPVVTSTIGATITSSMFDPVASGFQYNDLFTAGTVAHIFWFVADNMGHSHTFEYFIFFEDNSPPTFDLTGIFDTLQFSSIVQVPVQTAIPAMDNCTPVVNETFSQTTPPDTCESGTFTRTWMATDEYGNKATYTQTIIIYKDTLPPLITGYPQNGSAPCELLATAYPSWLAQQIAAFSATDASGVKQLINNGPASFPPGCKVPLTVKFWAIDNCMNQQIVSVVFTTSDTKGPVVVKPPKDTVAYCSQSDNELLKLREWISTKAYSQAFDSCSFPLTYTMKIGGIVRDSAQVEANFLASFANGCGTQMVGNQSFNKVHGFVSVDFFVQDDCGNETFMGNADFGAIDTLPPTITGSNATEQCGGGNDQSAVQAWINAHGNAVVTEDCSNFSWTNFSFTTSTGQSGDGIFNVGPYPSVQANNCSWFTDVTFRATDDCGNSSTIKLRWSIIDTQAPSITGLSPNITVYCPNPLPTTPSATISDNCDANISISFSRIYKDSLCDGSYTVLTTWTATDDCGNSSSATQDIFVRDTTSPVFTLVPLDKTFRCDTFVLPPIPVMGLNIMATDVCSPVVSITTATASFQDPDPAVCGHYSYTIVRTFTATDECGNTQTATQTLTIVDNLGPVPGGILDTTALCSALTPFPAPVPLADDACSGPTAPPVSNGQTTLPGPCLDEYTIAVHWIASDVCGNTTGFDQLVHVIDTVPPTLTNIPPNVTVECNAIPVAPNPGTFNPTDNCGHTVSVTLVETEIRNPDTMSCEHWTNYVIQREWTATDVCGNNQTYTQLIQIEDTTPPAIVPPGAMTFPNDPNQCGADLTIPPPLSVTDICSSEFANANISDTKPLIPSGPGSAFVTPVASMTFQLAAPNAIPLQPVVGNPVLRVVLDSADAEGGTEDFNVLDEKGVFLFKANTNSQCGFKVNNFFPTAAKVNEWLADGFAGFSVIPNGSGANACNPICGGGHVTVRLEYTYANSDVAIDLTYSIDGGPAQNFPPTGPTFFPTGTHTIVYTATDCVGNSSTASVQVTVNDTQPPVITPPANITAFTGQNNCESTVTLPFPAIFENCAMSESLSLASAILPLHFENDANVGLVASDLPVSLTGIVPNAVGTGILTIRFLGDNAAPGEFFNVYDEAFNFIGTTGQDSVQGECSTLFETQIVVNAADINNWGIIGGPLGSTSFYLESNRDLLNYSEFVGNCAPLLPNATDGISQIQVTLEYSYGVVNYAVKNPANQTVASGVLLDNTTTVTLPPANYTVMYSTLDNSGLTGMATFGLTVRDTVKPKAMCQPTFIIQVNPSGAAPFTLTPAMINNGSTDNCTPTPNLLLSVSPNSFTCNQAGTTVSTTLTVTDTSGNSASCQTLVGVTTTPPNPMYTPVCENDTLQLFAKPPSTAPFSYLWNGPNGYSNNQQNPIVTTNAMSSHNGPYCVTITGATGCTSSACVVVELAILSVTPQLNVNSISFCPGQNIVLTTNSYPGQNVNYQWLQDLGGNLIVLGVTTSSNFTIVNPPPGVYTYYLKVFANGCNTALSNPQIVTMHTTPPAVAEPANGIIVCEGSPISLQSTTPPTGGLTYMWTGPNGWTSTLQNPLVTNNAVKAQHEGKYILVTKRNGCLSNPDTVMVTVNIKPPKPSISGNFNVCEGQPVTLVCSVASGAEWIWTDPDFDTFVTTGNTLFIPSATAAQHEGMWTVIVRTGFGCFSDESNAIKIDVQQYPVITANSNAPICKDSLLKLTATFSSVDTLTWSWTGPNGFERFEQNPVVLNGASGTYQVIAKTSFGCADTATVDVTNVTPPVITFIGNNAPPCCDGTTDATLSATINSSNPPLTYLWTGPPAFGSSTLPSPVIADVCTPYNGQYMLVVKDSFNCPSLQGTTEINIQAPPVTPFLKVDPSSGVICAGDTITLYFENPTSGAKYRWNLPGGGTTTTTVPFLRFINAQPSQSGIYSVLAISSDSICTSGQSNAVSITINPIPPAPEASSSSPVCQGGTLSLFASDIPGQGENYMWTGPAGFSSMLQNPERSPVTLSMAGVYRVKVTLLGCTSPESSTTVVVVPTPQTPIIATPPDRICIDAPVADFLNILNPINGMEYTWRSSPSGIVLQGPSTSTNLFLGLPNVLALGPGPHLFTVTATTAADPGCDSAPSNTVSVQFDTIPEGINAFAGLDRFACADASISLTATPPPGTVSGFWTQLSGPSANIINANLPNASFVGIAGNIYTFVWSLSQGKCLNFSSDTVVISAQNPEVAYAGKDTAYCTTTGIQLHATQGVTAQGMWTQLPQQASLGIVIDNPSDPNTTISGALQKGQNYVFYWEIGNIGCGIKSDAVIIYIYSPKPNAGPNLFVCNNQNCVDLSASPLANFETGEWSSPDPNLVFTNPGSPNTTVCGLQPGNNLVIWTINKGVCGNPSRDTVEIYFALFPTAVNDVVNVDFGDTVHFNVLLNDILPNSYSVTVLTQPSPGSILESLGDGRFVYRPQSGFTGTDNSMTYSICNTNCPSSCSIGTVRFEVGDAPECFIPTIITPNGDGFNDQFTIPVACTLGEGAANLDVTIFNQWGDLVFHAKPYLNDWEGTYNSEQLPAGTYFFVVRLNENEQPRTGFLLIQR